jgi:indole-3-glycerol phosphate synthase
VGNLRARIAAAPPAVIAEIKKASPSKGVMRDEFDVRRDRGSRTSGRATCLSVLTDASISTAPTNTSWRRGRLQPAGAAQGIHRRRVSDAQSRALGADAILLIVSALDDPQLAAFEAAAQSFGMAVLVECTTSPNWSARSSCRRR